LFTWVGVGLFTTALVFLLKPEGDISHGAVMVSAVLQIVLLHVARWVEAKLLRSIMAAGTLAGSPVVTIGEAEELLRLNKSVLFRYFGLKEVARVTVGAADTSSVSELAIDIDRAIDEARIRGAARFAVVARWSSRELLETVRDRLRASPLPAHLMPDYTCRSVLGRRTLSTRGQNLMVEIQRAPLTTLERAIKRAMDIVMSLSAIVMLSPIFVITAIAIKLDSRGNVIFRQRRNGFNSKQFVIYKFRTMTVEEDGPKVTQARRGDHRVTRVGQFLRRSSIDELPQLFNVLQGHMSIVGPRPHALAHDDEYKALIAKYAFRHHVKPGMTGWAQVNGLRGETQHVEQMAERIRLDLWYIDHWSLGLDLNIVLRTCVEVLRDRAY
jgi:Undecaprenyl-phosphate glucose phosphotransferase